MALEFTWDPAKSAANHRKHGLDFEEALTAFDDPMSTTIQDPAHSAGERRFLLLGRTRNQALVVVSHTERGDRIRIISARRATRREKMKYEEGI